MFPFVMPSSSDPKAEPDGVTTRCRAISRSASCSPRRCIFLPLVLLYTGWAYRVMRGKVTADYVRAHEHSAY